MIGIKSLMTDILVGVGLSHMAGGSLAGTDFQAMVGFIQMIEVVSDVDIHPGMVPKIGGISLLGIGHLTEGEVRVGIGLIPVTEIPIIGLDTLPETFHTENRIVALIHQKE